MSTATNPDRRDRSSGLTPAAGRDLGLDAVVEQARGSLESVEALLADFRAGGRSLCSEPVRFDSESAAILAYTEALRRVKRRFWATTFLSSGFWSRRDGSILAANLRMMANLQRAGVVSRRLFLLPLPPDEVVQRWQDEAISLRKCDDLDGVERLRDRFSSLSSNLDSLTGHGCDVRVVYDLEARHHGLPAPIAFDPRDSELAIYDDWRFDLFYGGSQGAIRGVECFTAAMERFAPCRRAVLRYFDELWRRARPIASLLERIDGAMEYSCRRIDYQPIWLARYDHALPEEDRILKAVELNAVRAELKRLDRWGKIRRFLDVGTCTGRYPISLAAAVAGDGSILGIDNDVDCVRFARRSVAEKCGDDPRIAIHRQDFSSREFAPGEGFDLITCMLGTLLHFAHQRNGGPAFDDPFQRALEKLAGLLTPDGDLFFSAWSAEALAQGRTLSIYAAEDHQRLVSWTPGTEELRARLSAAGLTVEWWYQIEDRMDLYRCRRS